MPHSSRHTCAIFVAEYLRCQYTASLQKYFLGLQLYTSILQPMAEQYGFSKPPKQYTGILIQQIPGSSYSILQYTANPVSNHRPMVPGTRYYCWVCLHHQVRHQHSKTSNLSNNTVPGTWYRTRFTMLVSYLCQIPSPNHHPLLYHQPQQHVPLIDWQFGLCDTPLAIRQYAPGATTSLN